MAVEMTVLVSALAGVGIIYLQGSWKNNEDNMELQSDTGRIALIYYAKSVNIVTGGKGEGIVTNDNEVAAV